MKLLLPRSIWIGTGVTVLMAFAVCPSARTMHQDPPPTGPSPSGLVKVESQASLANYHAGYASYVLALMVGPGGLQSDQGDSRRMQELVDDAVALLEASVKANPESADALALLAQVTTMQLRSDPQRLGPPLAPRLRELRAAAPERGPDNPRVVLLDAMRLFWAPAASGGDRQKGIARWHEALALFAKEPRRDPALPDWGHPEAWAWLGGAHLALQPPEPLKAKAAVEKALEIRPDFLWARTKLMARVNAALK